MPKPVPGSYYIVNADGFYNETYLAVTYDNVQDLLTVTPLGSQSNQEWFIADYRKTDTQSISPKGDTKRQVCYKSAHELTVRRAHNYVWTIVSGQDDKYTIQDGHKTAFWDLQESAVGQPVYLGVGNPSSGSFQNWRLITAN